MVGDCLFRARSGESKRELRTAEGLIDKQMLSDLKFEIEGIERHRLVLSCNRENMDSQYEIGFSVLDITSGIFLIYEKVFYI